MRNHRRPMTDEDLEELLRAAGLDWDAAQRMMAPELGLDPARVGTIEQAAVIVCTAWRPGVFAGSTRHRCMECGAAVAMTRKSVAMAAARPEVRVLCVDCTRREMDAE